MIETVVAHVTKAGYDLIARKLGGEIEELRITSVAFGGGLSPRSLAPYKPSIYDTSIPNELFRVEGDKIQTLYDPEDGLMVVRVTVDRELAGNYYLNAVGIYANETTLFASNSLALLKVDYGSELVLHIKIPFLPDTAYQVIDVTPPSPESSVFCLETFRDVRTSQLVPAGYSGLIYEIQLSQPAVHCYFTLEVGSVVPLVIDHISISLETSQYGSVVLFSDITLDISTNPKLSVKIPQPFRKLEVYNKPSQSDVVFSVNVTGVKLR
jgi:hypothetical protein